ncbi:hypothetical protein [Phytohabitans rumicis]|uniref:Uncharacterized protein n=1 Tax=Phytohabitans rumicis TaxID=1076125 RepID=A0A6V8KX05_9ACTN|nr:hypothetical protein [Phytohabitans rumicis]GFJ89613.1 hypothetical protein Prum_032550 [Phytohabitans rumicis]
MSAQELSRAVDLLVRQTGHWAAPRWAAQAGGESSRGDLLYALVQRLADRAADAEGQPRRPVPRLPTDTALIDQFRVVTADLLAATPPPTVLAQAATDISTVRHSLT